MQELYDEGYTLAKINLAADEFEASVEENATFAVPSTFADQYAALLREVSDGPMAPMTSPADGGLRRMNGKTVASFTVPLVLLFTVAIGFFVFKRGGGKRAGGASNELGGLPFAVANPTFPKVPYAASGFVESSQHTGQRNPTYAEVDDPPPEYAPSLEMVQAAPSAFYEAPSRRQSELYAEGLVPGASTPETSEFYEAPSTLQSDHEHGAEDHEGLVLGAAAAAAATKLCSQKTSTGRCTNHADSGFTRCSAHRCGVPGCTKSKSSQASVCPTHLTMAVYAEPSAKQSALYDDGKVPGAADHVRTDDDHALLQNTLQTYGSADLGLYEDMDNDGSDADSDADSDIDI